MKRPFIIVAAAFVVLFVSASSGILMGAQQGGNPKSEICEKSRETIIVLRRNKEKEHGRIAIRSGNGDVKRVFIPEKGLLCTVDGQTEIRYVNNIYASRTALFQGQKHISDPDELKAETVIKLSPEKGRTLSIKVVNEKNQPLGDASLNIYEVWNGHEIVSRHFKSDKDGVVKAFVAEDRQYKLEMKWMRSAANSESKSLIPGELKDGRFTFIPEPPERKCFVLRFVEVDGNTRTRAKWLENIEIVREQCVLHGGIEGKFLLMLGKKELVQFREGEKLRLRLPYGAAQEYELVDSTVVVGKAGEAVDVEIMPIVSRTANVQWRIHAPRSAEAVPIPSILVKPLNGKGWRKVSPFRKWKCNKGEYEVMAFCYGCRLYQSQVVIDKKSQTVPIRLKPSSKCSVTVTIDGNRHSDIQATVLYPEFRKRHPDFSVLLTGGKGDVYFDGNEKCGLLVEAKGCASKIIPLEKGTTRYQIALKTTDPIEFRIEPNEVVKGLKPSVLRNMEIMTYRPWRTVIAKVRDGKARLGPGRYIPIINFATPEMSARFAGKVVMCDPIVLEKGEKEAVVKPERIISHEKMFNHGVSEEMKYEIPGE